MITEGYLARHYQGRADGRSPALIDIAQDLALHLLPVPKVRQAIVDDRMVAVTCGQNSLSWLRLLSR